MKLQLFKMNKGLRDLFREYFSPYSPEDKLYQQCIMHSHQFKYLQKHLIISNVSKMITVLSPVKDDIIQVLLTLLSQNELIQMFDKDLEKQNKQRPKDILKKEKRLKYFIEALSSTVLWLSHGVYDRNCDISLRE